MMETEDRNKAPQLSLAAIAALQQGNKIEAIKITRQDRDLGLKEAKDLVDDYVRHDPAIATALAQANSEGKRNVLVWLLVLIVAALLAYRFLIK